MQSITGLAIPRHTGLGYLVTKDFKKRVPLNAFYVFNLFQGKGFYREYYYKKYNSYAIKLNHLIYSNYFVYQSDEHASGR